MRRFLLGAIFAFAAGLCVMAQAQTTYEHDIAFESLIGKDSTRYAVGTRVPLQARFINSGSKDVDSGRILCYVYDYSGQIIHANMLLVDSLWKAGSSRDIYISFFLATFAGGVYHVKYCTNLKSDENRDNDCSAQYASTFYTVLDSSVAAGSPDRDQHQPLTDKDYTVREPVPVEIPFANLSSTRLTDVPLRAIISSSQGNYVYDRTVNAMLEPGITSTVQFLDFIPYSAGTYCIKAWSSYSSDNVPENDTVTWCFTVKESTAGVSVTSAETPHLNVLPNPVALSATIEYATPGERATRIIMSDAGGEIVRTVPISSVSDAGTLTLDMTALPTGTYTLLLVTAEGSSVSARMIVQK